jgi:predicted esterase
MKRLLALLPLLFGVATTVAAQGLTLGGITEFKVELPKDLRTMAGRGQLSPLTHALVTIAAPSNLDMAHEFPVMIISATSDPDYNSSRKLLLAYYEIALQSGWILVAADPATEITVAQDDVPMRLALNTAALAVLAKQWPGVNTAPLAFGGFSGGAKYSEWLAASFAGQGRNIIGLYLAGINTSALGEAALQFNVSNDKFKRVPVFLQFGDADRVSTPNDHQNIASELKRAGFKNVQVGVFTGAHEVDPRPLRTALEWFRQFTMAKPPTGK